MGTQASTALRFSKRTLRSTERSRTTGNLESGARRMGSPGCSFCSVSTSVEQAMRARPLIDIHSYRDFFQAVGVVGDGGGGRAVGGDGLRRDLAQQRGDVHVGAIGDGELFGARGCAGGGLAEDSTWMVLGMVLMLRFYFCASARFFCQRVRAGYQLLDAALNDVSILSFNCGATYARSRSARERGEDVPSLVQAGLRSYEDGP